MIHKINFLLLVSCLIGTLGWGQQETLFNNTRLRGGFGALLYEYGISEGMGQSAGGGGGLVFDRFFIGLYGMTTTDLDDFFNGRDVEVLDLAQGGLWIGITPESYNVIHPIATVRAGYGALDIRLDDSSQRYEDLDKVFVLTPELGVELNVTRWFRIAGTASYRAVLGTQDDAEYTNADFSGWVGGISLRFGWFGRKRWN